MISQHDNSGRKRWIVKIGSSLVTANGQGLDYTAIATWGAQLAALRNQGHEIIIVSSGSIAEGMVRLNWQKRPNSVHELQAAAAVGQMGLVQAYEENFKKHNIKTAQILLTHDDLADRRRYINARSTLNTLLQLGVVPIVNENDTVTTEEIRFGDNDTLGALVANLTAADLLVILTDIDGLYDKNPSKFADAKLIKQAQATDKSLLIGAGPSGSDIGQGGMLTKVQAAMRAARSGTDTIIASGEQANVLESIAAGESIGTLLTAPQKPLAARKQWLANRLKVRGELTLDDGAIQMLTNKGASLLSIGVIASRGKFVRGDLVSCKGQNGIEVARGLINYNAAESKKLLRQPSATIENILGYIDEHELIGRDNLVLM